MNKIEQTLSQVQDKDDLHREIDHLTGESIAVLVTLRRRADDSAENSVEVCWFGAHGSPSRHLGLLATAQQILFRDRFCNDDYDREC